jgi:hypothetical protein
LRLLSVFLRLGIFWSWEKSLRVRKFWSRECTNHGGAWPLFTAEKWRTFLRLRLVLPICSMTSFFTNFYFFGTPNIALHLGGSIGSFYRCPFFLSCGSPIYFSDSLVDCSKLLLCLPGGSFIMIHVSYCGLFQNSDHVPR